MAQGWLRIGTRFRNRLAGYRRRAHVRMQRPPQPRERPSCHRGPPTPRYVRDADRPHLLVPLHGAGTATSAYGSAAHCSKHRRSPLCPGVTSVGEKDDSGRDQHPTSTPMPTSTPVNAISAAATLSPAPVPKSIALLSVTGQDDSRMRDGAGTLGLQGGVILALLAAGAISLERRTPWALNAHQLVRKRRFEPGPSFRVAALMTKT